MKRVFGSAGQRVGQRVFLRLLEDDRVVDDRRGLLGDAIEQPAVVVGVDRRRRCGRREIVPMNRSLKTSGQTSADCSDVASDGDAGGFEVGARPRVDQRPAVARHPAGQARARS